mmetsp:Transcript_27167/g.40120  ORF Transcript_27167/g.40120 Transcript_27167/m.40120 type:complete len:118 (+) Transcript_27167:930-1283(+)
MMIQYPSYASSAAVSLGICATRIGDDCQERVRTSRSVDFLTDILLRAAVRLRVDDAMRPCASTRQKKLIQQTSVTTCNCYSWILNQSIALPLLYLQTCPCRLLHGLIKTSAYSLHVV